MLISPFSLTFSINNSILTFYINNAIHFSANVLKAFHKSIKNHYPFFYRQSHEGDVMFLKLLRKSAVESRAEFAAL